MKIPVECQVYAMSVAQTLKRQRLGKPKGVAFFLPQPRACKDRAVCGETHEAAIEGRIPKSRKEQAVVHIEALCVCAISPRFDVGRSEECPFGNAGHRTLSTPVFEQGVPEYVLANALDNSPFGFGRSGKIGRLAPEAIEWSLWQAHSEPVDAIEHGVLLRLAYPENGAPFFNQPTIFLSSLCVLRRTKLSGSASIALMQISRSRSNSLLLSLVRGVNQLAKRAMDEPPGAQPCQNQHQ
jgi:hypothetical protein